jgi:hypothetical protein
MLSVTDALIVKVALARTIERIIMKQAIWALLAILVLVLGACAEIAGGTMPAQIPTLTQGQWSNIGSNISYVFDKGQTSDSMTTISYVCGQDKKPVVNVFQAYAVSAQNGGTLDVNTTTQTILFPKTLSPIAPFTLAGTVDTGGFINAVTGEGKDVTLIPTTDEVRKVVTLYDQKYCG